MHRSLMLLALAAAVPAHAAVAFPSSVESLARASDAVVRGRVVRLEARWSGDGKRILTRVEVSVGAVWRGQAPGRITVVVPGGSIGPIGQRVDGAASLAEGEEVVLFVQRTPSSAYRVTGLAQGKYRIEGGAARPELAGMHFIERPVPSGERMAEPMPVEELERRVRAAR